MACSETKYETLAEAMKDGWLIATKVREARDISGKRRDGYTYELPNGEQSVLINLTNEPMRDLPTGKLVEEQPEPTNPLGCLVPMFHITQVVEGDQAES